MDNERGRERSGLLVLAYVPWIFKTATTANDVFDSAIGLVKTSGNDSGPTIGVEFQLNTVTQSGSRDSILTWNGIGGQSYQQCKNYGEIRLITGDLNARGIIRGAREDSEPVDRDNYYVNLTGRITRFQISNTTAQNWYVKGQGFQLMIPPGFDIMDYSKVTIKYAYWAPSSGGSSTTATLSTTTAYYVDAYFFEPWDNNWFQPDLATGDQVAATPANGGTPDVLPTVADGLLQRVGGRRGVADLRPNVEQEAGNPPPSGWATWPQNNTDLVNNIGFTYTIDHNTFNRKPGGSGLTKAPETIRATSRYWKSVSTTTGTKATRVTLSPLTGITLDKISLILQLGGSVSDPLVVSRLPAYSNQPFTVAWASSNTAVATVANGVVSPITAGTATIIAIATGSNPTVNNLRNHTFPNIFQQFDLWL